MSSCCGVAAAACANEGAAILAAAPTMAVCITSRRLTLFLRSDIVFPSKCLCALDDERRRLLANTAAQLGDRCTGETVVGEAEQPHRDKGIALAGDRRLYPILGPGQSFGEPGLDQLTAKSDRHAQMQFTVEVDM